MNDGILITVQDRLELDMAILDAYVGYYDDLLCEERQDNERIKEIYKTYSPEEYGSDCFEWSSIPQKNSGGQKA